MPSRALAPDPGGVDGEEAGGASGSRGYLDLCGTPNRKEKLCSTHKSVSIHTSKSV
jgi:hypothetical protein